MAQSDVLSYLRSFGKGTVRDFVKYTGKSRSAVAISIMKLQHHGEIRRMGWMIISGIKFALYSLNDKKMKIL